MIRRSDLGVSFPEFDGQLRIALEADAPAFLRQVQEGEHFAACYEDKGRVIEWEAFGDPGLDQAVFTDLLLSELSILSLRINTFLKNLNPPLT